MKEIAQNNQVIWFDEALLLEDPNRVFDVDFWRTHAAVIGSASGRGTTWFVQGKKLDCALRHYRRGGLLGKVVKDSYLYSGWENTRSYQELKLLERLSTSGVNVPRPVAARAIRKGLTYTADLLSEKIPNARDLVSILEESEISIELCQEVGVQIRKMHDLQVNHTDLNIHNILIDNNEKVWIIDFDKCGISKGHKWKSNNIARLQRSFQKEIKKRNIHWSEDNWKALYQSYSV